MKVHPSRIKAIYPVRRYHPVWFRVQASPRAIVYNGWRMAMRPKCTQCGSRHFFRYRPSATELICYDCSHVIIDPRQLPVPFTIVENA